MIDLGRALQHPFEDRDWASKLLIGAAVNLVPILNFAMMGYSLDVLRNTSRGQDVPLPAWDDFGKKFVDGLKLFVAQLVYALPLIVVAFVYVFGTVFLTAMTAAGEDRGDRGQFAFVALISLVSIGFFCFAFIYSIFIGIIMPALYIQLARTGDLGSCFRLRELWAIVQRRTGDYALVALVLFGLPLAASIIVSLFTAIPILGALIALLLVPIMIVLSSYYMVVSGHLYGQLAR